MKRWIVVVIAALMVFSLACSAFAGGSAPNNEGTSVEVTVVPDEDEDEADVAEPAEEEDEDVAGDEEMSLEDIDADAFEQLSSYRAEMTWTSETADGTVEEFSLEQAATRDPAATRYAMTSDGETVEYIQVDGQLYMHFGEDWMQTGSDEEEMEDFGDFLSVGDEWMDDVEEEDYEYLGTETVNDVSTRHYQIEYDAGWGALLGAAEDVDTIESGTADVWVADEANLPAFVVRFVAVMNATVDEEDATMTLEMNVYDINESFTIEAPEGVGAAGLPEGVPVYEGAMDVTSFGPMMTFYVEDDVETVASFYEAALKDAGWSQTGDAISTPAMVNSIWEKDDQTLTLMVGADEDAGNTQVMIAVETAE